MGRARDRATRRQPADPPPRGIYRAGLSESLRADREAIATFFRSSERSEESLSSSALVVFSHLPPVSSSQVGIPRYARDFRKRLTLGISEEKRKIKICTAFISTTTPPLQSCRKCLRRCGRFISKSLAMRLPSILMDSTLAQRWKKRPPACLPCSIPVQR